MENQSIANLDTITREEWLSLRKLGSSDAAAVCGVSEWKSPYEVWAEKVGLTDPAEETEAMELGSALEPAIASIFAKRTGLKIERCREMFAHPEFDFLTATPDFFVWEGSELGILEIKNTNVFASKVWQTGLPDPAHVQIMHQHGVIGRDVSFAYGCALIGGNRVKWHRVERDEGVIARIVEIENDFWKLVQSRTPPPLRADDGEALARIYPESSAVSLALPDAASAIIAKHREAKGEIKRWESEADYAATQLKAMLGEAELGTHGEFRVSWKTQHRKEYVVKASSFRKFEIREQKQKEACGTE